MESRLRSATAVSRAAGVGPKGSPRRSATCPTAGPCRSRCSSCGARRRADAVAARLRARQRVLRRLRHPRAVPRARPAGALGHASSPCPSSTSRRFGQAAHEPLRGLQPAATSTAAFPASPTARSRADGPRHLRAAAGACRLLRRPPHGDDGDVAVGALRQRAGEVGQKGRGHGPRLRLHEHAACAAGHPGRLGDDDGGARRHSGLHRRGGRQGPGVHHRDRGGGRASACAT